MGSMDGHEIGWKRDVMGPLFRVDTNTAYHSVHMSCTKYAGVGGATYY